MYRRHGDKLALVFLAGDLAVTAATWTAAYFLRFALWPSPLGRPHFEAVLQPLPLVLLLAAGAYRLCGLYEVHRLRKLPSELGLVFQASALMFLLVVAVTFFRREIYESRLALVLFLALNAATLTLVRRVVWRIIKYFRGRGLNYGRAVIVGAGRSGRQVARTILANPWTGLEAVGFVDRPRLLGSRILPRLGDLEELPEIVAQHDVDHVFIALPLARYGELPKVYRILSDVFVDVQLVPALTDVTRMRLQIVDIDGVSFLGLRQNPQYGWPRVAKRTMDLVLGSIALVLAAPLMGALAAAIKLTSRGPVFHYQTRTGLQGRTFWMLKFRSMHVDAEGTSGPVWTVPGDRRCTAIGRLMRRWSLDELPQLFNVLRGDMSLVGPRPERGVFVEKFRQQIPGYDLRHQVKAGMTGWAQVQGWRGNSSLRHRLRCDLYYVANWSLWLDLQILALTLWRGFRHRHAY